VAVEHLLSTDVLRRQPFVRPEEVVLGTFTFLPYVRTGAAAALRTPFSTTSPARATLPISVTARAGATTATGGTTLQLRGPGDVLALDPRQVIRRYPEPDVADAEPSDLVHVEFDTPDLPWQFTPTGPDARGHLMPWLRLIAVPASTARLAPPVAPGLPPVLTVPKAQLPAPDDAWAWAHVQVIGPPDGDPGLLPRLSPTSPTTNLSRLLCPRKLDPHVAWVAAVVPVFDVGRRAGLREPVPDDATLQLSWGPTAPDEVRLPAYDLWQFATGKDGDFETLAERLRPVSPTPGVGRRRVDTSRPGMGIEPVPDAPVRQVSGPLVRVGDPTTDGVTWPDATTLALRQRLDQPDEIAFGPEPAADPTLGPPLYGGAHLARRTVPEAGTEPAWFAELNLDPADRIVAGLGTRVVQMDQDELMTSAWQQVEGVMAANRALAAAALGRFVSESLHRRQLGRMVDADLVASTARAHTRLTLQPGLTVRAAVADSALPPAAVGPLLRRVARPAGPLARFAGPTAQDRAQATRLLRVDPDGTTRSWVRQYDEPDGVRGVRESTLRQLVDVMAEEAAAVEEAVQRLYESAFVSSVADPALAQHVAGEVGRDATVEELRRTLEHLLAEMPTRDEVDADPRVAVPEVRDLARQALAVIELGFALNVGEWSLRVDVVERLEVGGSGDPDHVDRLLVVATELREVLVERWRQASQYADLPELIPDERVLDAFRPLLERQEAALADDLASIGDTLRVDAPAFGDRARDVLAVADLGLLDRLDPRVTAVRRIRERIRRRPAWLPHDWFDDGRLERVMVAPRFRYPMLEALDRYEREWLLPGIAEVSPHEMTTLLSTNPRFVEAFLVGLNTEMARELLWREYPTDGRATSFRSFFTREDELLAEVHALGPGVLGAHIDPRFDGAIVLLVRGELIRRYPDVLAHAVPQIGGGWPPTFAAQPATTLFRLPLSPDLLLVGFDVKSAAVSAADTDVDQAPPGGAWWFVLSEHVGQPRFGLDEGAAPAGNTRLRDDLVWDDFPRDGAFLRAADPTVPVSDRPRPGLDAAVLGWLLFQQPSRAAFRGARMIAGAQ
jgi:hypothetical protein